MNLPKDHLFTMKMDKKLYEQLLRYSKKESVKLKGNVSLAEISRQAIEKFINEEKNICSSQHQNNLAKQ